MGAGSRVLVVEDELMIRMLLEDMLGDLGYATAAEAGRIEEALEATKKADFDLAILDATSPSRRSPMPSSSAAHHSPIATG